MKKLLAFLLALLTLTGCAAQNAPEATPTDGNTAEPTELIVFAAASLTETLTAIAEQYRSVAPEVTLRFNFDSSGTLKTQIEEGADCDLFLSAAPKQMNALSDGGLIAEDTRLDLLENKVVLTVPDGNPEQLASFDDLAARLDAGGILLAVGNSDVPVGQYTQKIFEFYGLDESALAESGVLTYGGNVKEVTTQVVEAAADCGIVYATDAFSAGLTVVDEATAEMCGQVIYPAAVTAHAARPAEAAAFLSYLSGTEASAIFESVGFTSLTK
ncbi:MAG: molybdate ABC transporter substrate-binding protein [Oscillospiraceae bacterium]|nr:molybdate ABC transporter substrate-binding protein [Oscillospiraceae bacterium]